MDSSAKTNQKRAALSKYLTMISCNLNDGINSILYWRRDQEAADCRQQLLDCQTILTEMTADKATIMEAATRSEDIAFYLMSLWNRSFCGEFGYQVNEEFRQEVDANYAAYIKKVQASVNAKQSHAPGFD